MKSHDILNLAVMFRTNDPNLRHCSTLDAMNALGMGFLYGSWFSTPKAHKRVDRQKRDRIASLLEKEAQRRDTI